MISGVTSLAYEYLAAVSIIYYFSSD